MTVTGSKQIDATDYMGRTVRYKTIGEPLGSGSGGTVYLAVRLPDEADDEEAAADDSRRVAIKVAQLPKWQGFLADEARLLHSLGERADEVTAFTEGIYRPIRIHSGPSPLKMTDALGSSLIELEYLDGATLERWFESAWRSSDVTPTEIVDEVLRTGRQIAEALIQIQQGETGGALIHRDIKPANIMRTSRGIRLFDFNVARIDSSSDKTQHVGTPGYMAPEVIEGRSYDGRADLFSLGVILWEIAHREYFELNACTTRLLGKIELDWPYGSLFLWSPEDLAPLDKLLSRLVTDVDRRLRSPADVLTLITSLEAARRPQAQAADPTARYDMVSLLSELRPSAMAAVVTDTNGKVPNQDLQDFLRERMQVDDPLEDWLLKEVVAASRTKSNIPTLFVLAGNAGDGKSHLLARLTRKRLERQPDVRDRIHAIADATHALSATDSQRDRLAKFFSPFADVEPTADSRVHLIAMNTGMVIRFFEGSDEQARYARLYAELQRQLGLRRSDARDPSLPWRVQVVNLDLRDLLTEASGPSFAERMLQRLSPQNAAGIPAAKWEACKQCSAFSLCPVAYNLRALEMPSPRKAVLTTLRRAALEADVHLSPRNMWGFLYRLVTGGVERYDVPGRTAADGPCDVIRRTVATGDGGWLLRGQFTELMFEQEKAGTPWSGIARHDPAFSSAPEIDNLHTRLSIKTELDNAPEIVEKKLGGHGQVLAGLSLDALTSILPRDISFKGRRRDAAVRRQVFFDPTTFVAWLQHDGAGNFDALLDAYQTYSKDPSRLTRDQQSHLTQLKDLTKSVFLHGNGRRIRGADYLRVSQPNARAESLLLVRADGTTLDQVFRLKQILMRDVHIVAHADRPELLDLLGYRPAQVTLDVLRVRLTVDLALHDFLRRVNDGQKPSVRDLAQFQSLLFIGERVGNELARQQSTKELFVWDDAHSKLFRLGTDDFGTSQLTPVEK
jgi:serine/threonine protein kinase